MKSRVTHISVGVIAVGLVALVVLFSIDVTVRDTPRSASIRTANEIAEARNLETVYHELRYLKDLVQTVIESNNTRWDVLTDVQRELLEIDHRLDRLEATSP